VHGIGNIESIGARSMAVIADMRVDARIVWIVECEIGIRLGRRIVLGPFECYNIISAAETAVTMYPRSSIYESISHAVTVVFVVPSECQPRGDASRSAGSTKVSKPSQMDCLVIGRTVY